MLPRMPRRFGVWLSSCPKSAREKAAAVLAEHIGLTRARTEVADAGGRCVAHFKLLSDAQDVADRLKSLGCRAGASEGADWP